MLLNLLNVNPNGDAVVPEHAEHVTALLRTNAMYALLSLSRFALDLAFKQLLTI